MARDSGSGLPSGGSDIVTVELTAAEAAAGTTKTIALPPDGRLIAINLPAGIGDGAILRLPRNDAGSTDGPPELTIHIRITSDDPTSVIPLPTPYDATTPIALPGDDEKTTVLPAGPAVIPAPDSDADERTTVFATTPPATADDDRTTVISTGTPPAPDVTEPPASSPTSPSPSSSDAGRTTDIPAATPSSSDDDRTAAIPTGTPAAATDDDRTAAIPTGGGAPQAASADENRAANLAGGSATGGSPATGADADRTDVISTGAITGENRTTDSPAGSATGDTPANGGGQGRTSVIAAEGAPVPADEDRTTVIPVAAPEQTPAENRTGSGDETGRSVAPAVLAAGAAGAAAGAAVASARSGDDASHGDTPSFNAESTQHVPAEATGAPAGTTPAAAAADATPPGYTLPSGTGADAASEAAGAGVPPTSGAPSTAYPPTPGTGYQPAPGGASTAYPPAPGTPAGPPASGVPAPAYPPAPGTPGYPPVSGAPAPAYPPAPGTPGYPPVSGAPAPAYPPAPGTPGYPPVSGAPAGGYPPVSGAGGYPPVPGAPGQPAPGAPGYPPVPGAPGYPQQPNAAGAPGYPPPPGTPGYPVSGAGAAGYPTSGVPASGVPNTPVSGAQAWGQPPQSGAPAWGQPGAYPLGAPGGFAAPPQQKPKRTTGLIAGVAVLVVLLCAGVVAVPWLINSGEPDPGPSPNGGGGPAPATSQAAVAMTTAQYQAMLSALDSGVQPAWDAMNRTTKPDALSSAADELGEMLGLQADELARVTPPAEVADEHEQLVDALNALSTDVLDSSLSAEGSALCTGPSAVSVLSRSDGGADLRDAATALGSADLKVGGWMPKALKEENRRPPNGNYYRRIQGGLGELKVENGGDHDALINLVKNGQTRPEVSFYVQAKGNFTASSIHDGAYTIYVTSGSDFDGTRFNRDCDFSKFDEAINYETTNSQYTIWEISLEATAGGNASTSDVPPGSFPE